MKTRLSSDEMMNRLLDARLSRRIKAKDRADDRRERRERAAEAMIGELCREGQTVWYVWPTRGRYREGTKAELVGFLLRNNYV